MVILGIEPGQSVILQHCATPHTLRAKPLAQPVERPFQLFLLLRIRRKHVELHRAMLRHQVRAAHAEAADRPVPGIVLVSTPVC